MHPSITDRTVPPHEFRSCLLNFTRRARPRPSEFCTKTTIFFPTELLQTRRQGDHGGRNANMTSSQPTSVTAWHISSPIWLKGQKVSDRGAEVRWAQRKTKTERNRMSPLHRKNGGDFPSLEKHGPPESKPCAVAFHYSTLSLYPQHFQSHFSKRKGDQQSPFIVLVFVYHTYTNTTMWSLA